MILILAGFLIIGWANYLGFTQRSSPASPLRLHAPCRQLTAGPSRLYACADGRSYLHASERWRDAGPLSPVPVVPAQ